MKEMEISNMFPQQVRNELEGRHEDETEGRLCVDLKSSPALNSTLWGRKDLGANYQQSVSTELHGFGKWKSHQCGKKKGGGLLAGFPGGPQ